MKWPFRALIARRAWGSFPMVQRIFQRILTAVVVSTMLLGVGVAIAEGASVTENRIKFAREYLRELQAMHQIMKQYDADLLQNRAHNVEVVAITFSTRTILEMQSSNLNLQLIGDLAEPCVPFNSALQTFNERRISMHTEMRNVMKATLGGPQVSAAYGPMMARVAEMKAEMESNEMKIFEMSKAVAICLVDFDKPGKPAHLIITKSQRKQMIDEIDRTFGAVSALKNETNNSIVSAAVVLKLLILKYKASDEPL